MVVRQFRTTLSGEANIAVEFTAVRGEVVSFVVRLMLNKESGDACVVRYDTAHGKPHLDRVDARGRLIEKEWLHGLSFADALCYAITDIKEHHEIYIWQFRQSAEPGG
jgi:hypothetical protein